MENIKFGLKLWSTNTDLIDKAIHLIDEKIFDYIELFVVPDTQIAPFRIDIPYIIHIPHSKFGVNISDASLKEYNLQKINESIMWTNELNAKYMILHPEYGSMDNAKDMLHEVSDSRLLIENMPKIGLNGEQMIGCSPSQIEELIGDNDAGLCLDFGHAVKAAVSLEVDYKEYVKKFLRFDPKVFHISDGVLSDEKDEHLNIGEGDYDFEYFLNCIKMIKKTNYVTIETPRENYTSFEDDIQNLDAFIHLAKYCLLNNNNQKS